jgi:hypothetical protein
MDGWIEMLLFSFFSGQEIKRNVWWFQWTRKMTFTCLSNYTSKCVWLHNATILISILIRNGQLPRTGHTLAVFCFQFFLPGPLTK